MMESTEGGITESLAMMNGEVTESLMSKVSDIKTAKNKNRAKRKKGAQSIQTNGTQAMQITSLYHAILSRPPREHDMKQCIAALNQGLDMGDIVWALLNSREFMFIQ